MTTAPEQNVIISLLAGGKIGAVLVSTVVV
jgi:hypothetical protein